MRGGAVHIQLGDLPCRALEAIIQGECGHIWSYNKRVCCICGLIRVHRRYAGAAHSDKTTARTGDGGIAKCLLLQPPLGRERGHVCSDGSSQRRVGDRGREAHGAFQQQRDAHSGRGGRSSVVVLQQLHHSTSVAALDRKLAWGGTRERRDGQGVVGRIEVGGRPRNRGLQLVLGLRQVHRARDRDRPRRHGLDVGQGGVQAAARDRVGGGLGGRGIKGERVLLERQRREDAAALDGVDRVLCRRGIEGERRRDGSAIQRGAGAREEQVLHVQAARHGHVARKLTIRGKGKVARGRVRGDGVHVERVDRDDGDGGEAFLVGRDERAVH
eukprot:4827256-Pleurochrysis_carterae.AAC.1